MEARGGVKRKKETGALEWLAQRDDGNMKAFLKRARVVNIKAEMPCH